LDSSEPKEIRRDLSLVAPESGEGGKSAWLERIGCA
jgi:hypothetical protein